MDRGRSVDRRTRESPRNRGTALVSALSGRCCLNDDSMRQTQELFVLHARAQIGGHASPRSPEHELHGFSRADRSLLSSGKRSFERVDLV